MTLAALILSLLTLDNGAQAGSCRPRCAEHAEALAHAIEGAAQAHDVDPLLLVALAFRESSLVGRDNGTSAGVFGFHRRSSLWRSVRAACGDSKSGTTVLQNKKGVGRGISPYLTRCLDAQADVAALEVKRLWLLCSGTQGALSAWQSGECRSDSGVRYAARVMRTRDELRGML